MDDKPNYKKRKNYRPNFRKRRFWNTDKIVSMSAISISLFTLIILVYQARLLNRQFELQRQQQYASVLPYLELGPSWGPDYFRINLQNTGIGPAFIKDFYVIIDQEKVGLDLQKYWVQYHDTTTERFSYSYSSLYQGRVIQPGSGLELIAVKDSEVGASAFTEFFNPEKNDFVFVVEYASVYDNRWIISTANFSPMEKEEAERLMTERGIKNSAVDLQ